MKSPQLLPVQLCAHSILLMILLVFIFSCKKDHDKGFVEINDVRTDGKAKTISINLTPGNITTNVITLKNQSEKAVHVRLALDSTGIGAISGLKYLAPSRFTLSTLEYDVSANGTVSVPISLNPYYFTADTVYGIGLKIENVSSGNIAGDAGKIILKLDFRNRWDGRYRVTGTFTDIAAPTLTFTEQEVAMITTNATGIKMIPKDLGIEGYLILSGTSLSYYGSFGPVFNFNATTNKITSVINHYGQPAANTRSAELDPSGSNQWDPATKAITVKFFQKQPSVVTTAPYIRVYFSNTLLYLGPRY